jgi:hypothetical protein
MLHPKPLFYLKIGLYAIMRAFRITPFIPYYRITAHLNCSLQLVSYLIREHLGTPLGLVPGATGTSGVRARVARAAGAMEHPFPRMR